MTVSLDRICELIGIPVPEQGAETTISAIASLQDATEGELSFLSNPRYTKFLADTNASVVIVPPGVSVPEGILAIIVEDPYVAFVKVLTLFDMRSSQDIASGIHERAVIDQEAVLGENVSIGPCAMIGRGVAIGDGTVIGAGTVIMAETIIGANCLLYPNVTIMDGCRLGNRVIIQAGAVIGSDGFGFAPKDGSLVKIPQIGRVRIEDDVEIGAGTCIDRAAFGETVIARGTKLDNLIQIAHNVKVGQSTVIASQTGVSGSTTIGSGVQIGGQAGFAGHIVIGDGASVGAQAGVTKDVPAGETVSDYPAKPHGQAMRLEAAYRRLPDLLKQVRAQEQRINELERRLSQQDEENVG